jgi:hypothetical protein
MTDPVDSTSMTIVTLGSDTMMDCGVPGSVLSGWDRPCVEDDDVDLVDTAVVDQQFWELAARSQSSPVVRFPDQRGRLLETMQTVASYHFLDDPSSLCFALAVGASNHHQGPPLWGMIIGPSSGGKTTALDLVENAAKERLDEVTVPGLLNLHQPNKKVPGVPRGLLTRIGDRGLVVISDFSTILSGRERGSDGLFSALRRIFDGRYQRDHGLLDEPLVWDGRVTFLAACTSSIDNYSSHSDSLGPRWVFYRLAPRKGEAKDTATRTALTVDPATTADKETKAKGLANMVLTLGGLSASNAELISDEHILEAVQAAAKVTCWGRGSVPRDSYGQREIIGIPETEEPPRVAKQLFLLVTHLLHIGLSDEEAISLMSRVAIDSMPAIRAKVLAELVMATGMVTSADIARAVEVGWKVANRSLEDLEALGLVSREDGRPSFSNAGAAESKPWRLVHNESDLIREVFARRSLPVLPELGIGALPEVQDVGIS